MPNCPNCGHQWDEGSREFTDSQGCVRRGNQWGFHGFATEDGARRYARSAIRRGRKVWIWRLPDGTFDYGCVESMPPIDCTGREPKPIEGAELVGELTT